MGESSSGAVLTVGKYCYAATKFASGAFGSIHYGWEKDDQTKKVIVKIVKNEQEARQKEARFQKKLKGHIILVHERKKLFKCDVCDSRFTDKKKLKVHITLVHERKKLFKCDVCDEFFTQKTNLKTHTLTIHQG